VIFAVYYRVSVEGKVRLETVSLDDAQRYARDIYRAEGVIASIDEIDRF
jgi:hypothetical protein